MSMLDHVAITVSDIPAAERFFDAVMKALDEGRPGLRDYHASYYGAFLRDPDGNRVEAVCHLAP
jgi:catechol 2,3-dioxygenase-like lactoylglutathione lyase family enzyme